VLPNGSTVTLQENSRLALTRVRQTPFLAPDLAVFDNLKPEPATSGTALELKSGGLVVQVRKLLAGSDFVIQTPVGPASVHGAAFALNYREDPAGDTGCYLGTANGVVVFTPAGGSPIETTANRLLEIRARVGPAGIRVQHVQTHILPEADREQIQRQNETARQDVNQVLMRARAIRNPPQPPEDRTVRPEPPANTPFDHKPVPPQKPEKPLKPDGP